MGTSYLRRVAAAVGIGLSASAAWAIDPVPNSIPAAGYPAGLPAPPIKDLTPTEFLSQPGHDPVTGSNGRTDLIPLEEPQAESGLVGSFEYLLLRPRRENLGFALVSSTTAPTPIGQTEALNFDRNSGVRAAVGYRFGEGWDASFAYSYFRATAGGSAAAPIGGILYPTLTRPGFVDSALVGSASAGVLQNVYDAEFGRRIACGDSYSARVYAGFRFADITQDFSAIYDGRDAAGSVVSTTNKFQGFGPIVGFEGAITVWRKFQLYGKASGGLLTGTSNAGLTETNQNGQSVYASYDSSTRKVVPTGTVGIGAGWQAGRLSVKAGYEISYWGSLIDTTRLSSDFSPGKTTTTSESLSLEGFFFRMGWEF
ncbi:MAG TPA: Lpg1974 family pore-forming outer membrane protein [Fimbriiglobus sp.]|jgi:hypothetical protein